LFFVFGALFFVFGALFFVFGASFFTIGPAPLPLSRLPLDFVQFLGSGYELAVVPDPEPVGGYPLIDTIPDPELDPKLWDEISAMRVGRPLMIAILDEFVYFELNAEWIPDQVMFPANRLLIDPEFSTIRS
jgi:hypothetical protein